jgi:hypothetical protein
MYCTTCECEYNGWKGKCPSCKQPLQEGIPDKKLHDNGHLDYTALVGLIAKDGKAAEIRLKATQVSRKKSTRFPYAGFGYAWTQAMQGSKDDIFVELATTEVGKDRTRSFPYKGHGFAWQQEVQGFISGNPCTLTAAKVNREKTWSLPYAGYGYAWTEKMHGKCGERILVEVESAKVLRKRNRRFPYFGFGYAWVDEYTLTLRLA